MGRLIMWNLMSLDGYFEGPEPWDLDWHNEVWGDELERFSLEQLASADVLVFGWKRTAAASVLTAGRCGLRLTR